MRNSTQKGDIVLDLYLGSASTMVAAEQLSRTCYALEIEPKYVAVALQRMADMGLKPELSNG
jgi:DNA modification methylase